MNESAATPPQTTAVAVANNAPSVADLMPDNLKLAVEQVVQSGIYGKTSRWEAATRIAAGVELGFSPMSSMASTYIVSGKLVMAYSMIGSLVQASKRFRFTAIENSAKRAAIRFEELCEEDALQPDGSWRTVRQWRCLGVSEFTIEEAKTAGLLNKPGPWQQYPKIMLFARAMSAGARMFTPSVIKQPVYVPGEIDADDEPAPRRQVRQKPEVIEAQIVESDVVPREAALRETVADVIGANG